MSVEDEPDNLLMFEEAHQEIVFPSGEKRTGGEFDAGNGGGGNPEVDGFDHAGQGLVWRLHRPVAIESLCGQRPAIVGARYEDIEFVSAHRSVFRGPDFVGFRVEGQALGVAGPVGVDSSSPSSHSSIVGYRNQSKPSHIGKLPRQLPVGAQ